MKSSSIALTVFTITLFISCSRTTEQANENTADTTDDTNHNATPVVDTASFDYDSFFKLESYITKKTIADSALEVIDFDCAILIYPDSIQIEEMIKSDGEENFYTIADDASFYQAEAITMIDSVGIKTINAEKQFLRIRGEQGTWDLDVRKKDLPAWNLIFFKKTKQPMIVSTIDLTVDKIKEYFQN